MITLKIKIKEDKEKNNIDVVLETPKDTSKATDHEKDVANIISEKLKKLGE